MSLSDTSVEALAIESLSDTSVEALAIEIYIGQR